MQNVLRLVFLIVIGFASEHLAKKIRYDGYNVIRALPRSEVEVKSLIDLGNHLGNKLDFWKQPSYVNQYVDFMTSPANMTYVIRTLRRNGIQFQIMIENVQDLINKEEQISQGLNKSHTLFDYNLYNDYWTIFGLIHELASSYPLIATYKYLGYSYLGMPIPYLKIGSPGPNKPVILIHGGIHAREWITPATMVYMIKFFLEGYGTERDITDLLNTYDFYIIPILNVDGYIYSWTTDRFWRKTRRPNSGSPCVGTDPNRNWDVHHCEKGASTDPCYSNYCGPYPFSEIEVRSLSELISSLGNRLKMYIDYHSYGQMWMTPYGYTEVPPTDYDEQYAAAKVAVTSLAAVHGTNYTYGTAATTIYMVSGGSIDWVYDSAGVKYSFALEGRDTGQYGFLLPANQIQPSAEENFAALKTCIKLTTNKNP